MSGKIDAPDPFQTEERKEQGLEEAVKALFGGPEYLPEEGQTEAETDVYQRLLQDDELSQSTATLRSEEISKQELSEDERPWRTITYVEARIVEERENEVYLECLLDKEQEIFEERAFDRSLFEGHIQIEIGKYVVLTILQKPGEQRIKVNNDNGLVKKDIFEVDVNLDELDSEMFNEPL